MNSAATDVAYLTRALKMPRARQVAASLADTARSEGWDYTEFLAKVLSEEVASRETHGGENRVKAARFPQVKTLDDFDFTHQRSVSRAQISHLAQLDFLRESKNIIFLGPPGTGKTHCETTSAGPTRTRTRVAPVMTRDPKTHCSRWSGWPCFGYVRGVTGTGPDSAQLA